MSQYDLVPLPQYMSSSKKKRKSEMRYEVQKSRRNNRKKYRNNSFDSDDDDEYTDDEEDIILISKNDKNKWYNGWVNKKTFGTIIIMIILSSCLGPAIDLKNYIGSDGRIDTNFIAKRISESLRKTNKDHDIEILKSPVKIIEYDPETNEIIKLKTAVDEVKPKKKIIYLDVDEDEKPTYDIERVVTIEDNILQKNGAKKIIYIDEEDAISNKKSNNIKKHASDKIIFIDDDNEDEFFNNNENEFIIENSRTSKLDDLLDNYKIKKDREGAYRGKKKKNYFVDVSEAYESPSFNEMPKPVKQTLKCHNGGQLINNKCICPPYFEGEDCSYKLFKGNVLSKKERNIINTQCVFDAQCLNLYAHALPNDITPINYSNYFIHGSYCQPKCINRQCYCQQRVN